ncbi:MAG: phenylalanine--tRNA ligase subunit beta [Chloroflexota bacterium]|jgi:phenylalanyl-tRNA synthetase beta chain
MRVPLSWLKDYVNVTLSVEELAEKLTIAGLEVTEIDYIGIPGGRDPERLVWDRDKLVMGKILEVQPHPNADRLVLAVVDYGGEEKETVVTGAPNLFPYLGQDDLSQQELYSPFAMEGTVLYDGHQEGQVKMKLKGRQLRGIYNRCMLCSEKELGISDEHEGIMILKGEYESGTPVQDVLGDAVLEIDIIPNIARCASIVGVAREVAALTGQKLREPNYEVRQEGPPVDKLVRITTDEPELNPRFVALVIEGVEQKPSPEWMQRRLRLAGQRPINVVVDISNYVMLEMGQPNHTFDYDFLRRRADQYDPDGPIHIHTRLPEEGERLITLDGVTHELPPFTILVTDPAGSLSLGGIMGGIDSEINEQTTNVLLEAAAWNFMNIRRSMVSLKINSEAGFRFSRGVHPSQALLGAKRAAELMRLYAGGTVAQGIVDYYPNKPWQSPIVLTTAEVKRIGGIDPNQTEIKQMLEALEFKVDDRGDHLVVVSPDHRLDIEHSQDLVEEVLRVYGYDCIPETEMSDTLPPQRSNIELEREEKIKDLLVQLGMQEVITYRLTTPEKESRLLPATNSRPDDRPYVTLANPITVDRVAMRHSLLASVLEIVAVNRRFQERMALFEIGQIYLAGEEGLLPDELRRLVLVMTGPRMDPACPGYEEGDELNFFDLKGIVENLFKGIHVSGLAAEAASHPTYRPGRTARLLIDDRQIGWLGELHPLVAEGFDIDGDWPVIAAELDLEVILPLIPDEIQVKAVSAYPAVLEDIALIVDRSIPAAEVLETIHNAGGYLLQKAELFDVYEGKPIPPGKKSLAYHLTFQAPDKTLTDKVVRKNRERIVKQLKRRLGATLRDA